MEKIRIFGNQDKQLKGKVRSSGAKNAVLPALAASLLTSEKIRLKIEAYDVLANDSVSLEHDFTQKQQFPYSINF